jgi:D-alanyl-lipoteichoic acid acyltransferase DltB (MBOAT superfamily)
MRDSWTGPIMMCIINFMVFCNGCMFFYKSVNATGRVQNAEFIRGCIREVIVQGIGEQFVV